MNGIQSVIDHLKQYDTNNILSLFPQPVYNTIVTCDDDEMGILKQQELYPVGNGSVSKDNHILDLTPKLKSLINEQANTFLVQLGFDFDVMIATSWINHHKQGEWCQDHMHTNSMLSGVLFLDIPPNSGEFMFRRPGTDGTRLFSSTIRPEVTKSNHFNSELYSIISQTNPMIIFPSYLTHSVSCNKMEAERWTVAFNLFPVGTIGQGLNQLTIQP